jgi:hypothetical protein
MTQIRPEDVQEAVRELELVREIAKHLSITEQLAAQLRGNALLAYMAKVGRGKS